jgi:hypothetical protein
VGLRVETGCSAQFSLARVGRRDSGWRRSSPHTPSPASRVRPCRGYTLDTVIRLIEGCI